MLLTALLKNIRAQTLSTDALRDSIRATQTENTLPQLFAWRPINKLSEKEWLELNINNPHKIAKILFDESLAIQAAIVKYAQSITAETNDDLIIEGVAVLPSIIQHISSPNKAVFLIDTSLSQADRVYNSMQNYDKDWMRALGYTKEKVDAWVHGNIEYSKIIKQQCIDHRANYIDISEMNLNKAIEKALDSLIK